jgi:hypothetical protein
MTVKKWRRGTQLMQKFGEMVASDHEMVARWSAAMMLGGYWSRRPAA